jgi:endonuclease G
LKKIYLLLIFFLIKYTLSFSQLDHKADFVEIKNLEIPKLKSTDVVISHTGYTLSYNEPHEQANWVAYKLTKEETRKLFNRTNKFTVDPMVITGTANDLDYYKSGYDKGHLAPAADMSWSKQTLQESFYYSNMSPQEPGFNRGIWKRLEEQVRSWAIEYHSVYIVTGPILTENLKSIGPDKVSVPRYFYKVILEYNEQGMQGIGFIIPNTSSVEKLQSYAVTIDSVENLTKIDFFPLLPNSKENIIESSLNLDTWSWKISKSGGVKEKTGTSYQRK